jgi:hypothetical protein
MTDGSRPRAIMASKAAAVRTSDDHVNASIRSVFLPGISLVSVANRKIALRNGDFHGYSTADFC